MPGNEDARAKPFRDLKPTADPRDADLDSMVRLVRVAIARLAGLVTTVIRRHRNEQAAARMAKELEAQATLIREQAASLAHSRKIFDRACEVAKIGVWQCDLASETLHWTDGVYDLFELPRGSAINRAQIVELYTPKSMIEMETLRSKAIRERSGFNLDAEIITAKGNRRWMRLTANVECEDGKPVRIFGMKQDITEEKTLWERMRFLAEFDVLTGLANRSLFQARLSDMCEDASREMTAGVLLLVDLDGFKQVNDTFGHALGDECLKQIGGRLRNLCREAELVARIGGDEFAVLMSPDRTSVEDLAGRIIEDLWHPIQCGEHSFHLGASIGVADPMSSGTYDPAELFAHADIALYAAKRAGKNTFRVFLPDMKSASDRRGEAVRNLTQALAEEQIELHYQPKVRLRDGRLYGFEALLRWRGTDGYVTAVDLSAPAFEDPELSTRLGRWMFEKMLRQAACWNKAALDFGHIAVNLGSSQLRDHRFAEDLVERIAGHGLSPEVIEVEISEGAFLEDGSGRLKKILERLRCNGVRIALDDFGTGFASLVHLRSYPIDVIKIDRSFVQRFLTSPPDRAIIEAILRLGSSLVIDVVAEGIETIAQRECLEALGCPFGQGVLISDALPAPEAARRFIPTAALIQVL